MDLSYLPNFLGSVSSEKYDILNYVARVQKHVFCPGHLKKWDIRGCEPAAVSFDVAKAEIDKYLRLQATKVPLREVLDVALVKSAAVLSPEGVKLIDASQTEVDAPLVDGYFVPIGRESDIQNSRTADAVAFQMTDTTTDELGIRGCCVTRDDETSLGLARQTFQVNVPVEFTSNPVNNATALFNLFNDSIGEEIAHGMCAQVYTQLGTDESFLNVGGADDASDDIVPLCVTNLHQSVSSVYNEMDFYVAYERHRLIRGADNESGLTSGYYFGAMSPGLDRLVSLLVDILDYSYRLKEKKIVFHNAEVSTVLYAMLAANGMTVFVVNGGSGASYYTSIEPLNWASDIRCEGAILYVAEAITSQIPYFSYKKGSRMRKKKTKALIGLTKSEFMSRFSSYIDGRWRLKLTHVYLRDYMDEIVDHLLPSTLAHRGVVMLCNTPLRQHDWTIKKLFSRAFIANKYKTAFPIHRVTFGSQDPCRPLSWVIGVRLVSGIMNTRKQTRKVIINYEDRDRLVELCRCNNGYAPFCALDDGTGDG